METGIKGYGEIIANETNTAKRMGSGSLNVFATPAMIALIENTCMKSVEMYLDKGSGTVGARIDANHISPTPLGMKVTCETELTAIDRRKLTFTFTVKDEVCEIGNGTHDRFIIDEERFQKKADEKLK